MNPNRQTELPDDHDEVNPDAAAGYVHFGRQAEDSGVMDAWTPNPVLEREVASEEAPKPAKPDPAPAVFDAAPPVSDPAPAVSDPAPAMYQFVSAPSEPEKDNSAYSSMSLGTLDDYEAKREEGRTPAPPIWLEEAALRGSEVVTGAGPPTSESQRMRMPKPLVEVPRQGKKNPAFEGRAFSKFEMGVAVFTLLVGVSVAVMSFVRATSESRQVILTNEDGSLKGSSE